MKKGLVTSDILTYAGATASSDAQSGLPAAQTASQAEQQRYQNSVNDLAVVASNAGVEEGFARIFRTLNAGLSESNGLVRILSEGFNDATKWADDLLLWPQSFVRALEGRDSLVADWLGKDDAAILVADWKQIQAIWKDITSISNPSWMPDLMATTKELAGILDRIAKLKGTSDQAKGIIQEEYDKDPSTWGNIKGVAKANWFTFTNTLDTINPVDTEVAKKNWGGWLGIDSWKNPPAKESPRQFDTPADEADFNADMLAQQQEDLTRTRLMTAFDKRSLDSSQNLSFDMPTGLEAGLGLYPDNSKGNSPSFYDRPAEIEDYNRQQALAQAEASVTNNNVTNQFDVTISVDATLAGIEVEQQARAMAEAFSTSLTGAFEQAQVNFPQK